MLLVLQGCALLYDSSAEGLYKNAGWSRACIPTGDFQLTWFGEPVAADATELHIYLGGDGRAFVSRQRIAHDPTGSEHLGLRLAIADPAPSAFLARPCYYRGAPHPPCERSLWSVDRYSPRVVQPVVAALSEVAGRYPQARLTLFGYSGGGVVALLAARHVKQVARVVTIAAPLDTAAWTARHGYTGLATNSDPAALRDWREELVQVHLVGENDREVPPSIAASFHERTGLQPPRSVIVPLSGYDHRCCWLERWPATLASLAREGGL